jgi:NAD(P)-dependent dehydrogenase (short-subunit alcohol dehydrogenase family)
MHDRDGEPRWAWVIGGTSGIGAAIATELSSQGWHVVASGRTGHGLEASGPGRWTLPADVTDDAAVGAAVEQLVGHANRLDAVILAARTPGQGTFLTMSDAEWHLAIDTKLMGFVRVARHVMPVLERSSGSLVSLVGSAAGFASLGHPLGCINAALRHAIRGLSLEWSPRGVRVLGISPGPTATPSLVALLHDQADAEGVDLDQIEERIAGPMFRKRLLRPEEIAALVAFAIGPQGALLNGSVLLADDGATGGCV